MTVDVADMTLRATPTIDVSDSVDADEKEDARRECLSSRGVDMDATDDVVAATDAIDADDHVADTKNDVM